MKRINVNLGDNFPEFKRKNWFKRHFPIGRPREIITAIVAAVFGYTASVTVFGVFGVGLTISGWVTVAVIGFAVWSMFSSKAGGGGTPPLDQNGQFVNTRQSAKVLPVVYGEARVGGNWVISRPSGTSNVNLNCVITWSEGEIEGIAPAIDFVPLFTATGAGTGANDIHTGGDFVFPGITQIPGPEATGFLDAKARWISEGQRFGKTTTPWIHYRVQIDYAGTIDTFKWSDDGGTTWIKTLVPITTELQSLNNGVTIRFESVTGHISGDYWDFYAGDGIFLGERLIPYYQDYGGDNLVHHVMHYGTATQSVDSYLKNEIKEWNEAMRLTAYSYFKLVYNPNAWKNIPDFTALIRGRKLYDPRDLSTRYSCNPALVWLDFLTNSRYGLGVPIAMVDLDSVEDVATWCDANDYYFNGVILDRKAFLDNFEDIMLNFRAFTVYSEGIYFLKVFTDDAAVMTLTDADIDILPESFSIKIPGIPESPARTKVTFADKTENHTANTTIYPKEIITQDAETMEREASEKTLIGINSQAQAQKIAKFGYIKKQFDKTFPIMAHPRCFVLEPGDMVQITHEFPGWTTHKVRVNDVGYPMEGLVPLTLTDESATIYTGDIP